MRLFPVFVLTAIAALAQDHPVEGNPKSVVRVVAYEDLQCSDCAVYSKMLMEVLLPKYGAKVAFEHRDFPLSKHAWAKPAAIAARFFDSRRPELGMEFRRWALANQSSITLQNFEAKLGAWAKSHGVEPDIAQAALKDAKLAKLVSGDVEEGVARGVARTPTVFVNGEPFIETFTAAEVSKSIDAALAATSTVK